MSILDLVAEQARRSPEAVSLLGPARGPLTYAGLHTHVRDTARKFRSLGIGRGDRVAIVLPNGPEMATAFLSVVSCATACPLNPSYGVQEFDFCLADLAPKALILESGAKSAATEAAERRGVPVIELSPVLEEGAGIFTLNARDARPSATGEWCVPEDVALVLYTSGTASRPKRVPLTHRSLCASAGNVGRALGLIKSDRCLNVMPLFHIHGIVASLLASLRAGASVVCAPGFIAPRFFEWIAEFHPTWYTAVPTMHQSILVQSAAHRATIANCPLRFIRSSSAALAPKVIADLEAVFRAPVVEAYGMTEASHQIAGNPLPPATRKPGSVGLVTGSEVAIMDEAGRLLAQGQTGEIVLRGENLTKGYENNPSANESAFTQGWFRTGDQGYLDPEGYLFITGRLKELINRGGEKISPREVDEALIGHPAILQAVTFAMPDARLGEDVAAAVVLKPNAVASEREIREFAGACLAAFKVPRRVLIVQDVPKGPTGKIQRIGLADRLGLKGEPEELHDLKVEYVAPRTPLERELAQLWAGILCLERIGIHDVFLHLGGDSILAAQLVSRIWDKFAVELSLISLLDEVSTIAGMAEQIEKARRLDASPGIPPLRRNGSEGAMPLSYPQQSWWFFHEYEPDASLCNVLFAYRLRGTVDIPALERSLHELVRRHALLRTVYRTENGRSTQRPVSDMDVPLTRSDAADGSVAEALRSHREDARRRFDLAQGPPMRAKLLRLSPDDHVLTLTLHHIVSDAWSEVILRRELSVLYAAFSRGAPSPLPPLPLQYADYALWQQELEASPLFARQIEYWKRNLKSAPPSCALGRGHARKGARTFLSAQRNLDLPGSLLRRLEELSRREGVSLFVALVAVFKVLLHRYTMQTDIVVGTPIAGRNRTELEGLIGCFVNMLALRTDLSGEVTFRELLRRVHRTVLGALEHQDVPFEKVVEATRPAREQGCLPLIQIVFEFLNLPDEQAADGPLRLERLELEPQTAQFDAHLCVEPKEGGLHCSMTYNPALFDAPAMDRMLGHFRALLIALAADGAGRRISELPLLTGPERQQVLTDWNRTATDYPKDKCVHQLFEEQVARTPGAVAIVDADAQWTYSELNARANRLARRLQALGVQPGAMVCIYAEPSSEMLAALLAILKAGAAYVPLDPSFPKDRLAFMIEDAGASILLASQRLSEAVPTSKVTVVHLEEEDAAAGPEINPDAAVEPDDLAYVIYTSGSTGQPKGVAVPHRAVVRLVMNTDYVRLDASSVMAQASNSSFDAATFEIWGALLNGGRLVIVPKQALLVPRELDALVGRQGINVLFLTTALFNEYAREMPSLFGRLRVMLFGGEAADPQSVAEVLRRSPPERLLHVYGPTEATTFATWNLVERVQDGMRTVPIGRPIANTTAYILDGNLNPVPIGVAGELCIGGPGLARGYLNQPELSAERFIRHPFSNEQDARLYKTGDLARYLPIGDIEFIGRLDHQVKIRGFRVELGEIEAALSRHPAVKEAVVIAREDIPGSKSLAAYVTAKQLRTPSITELQRFLEKILPDYMVPTTFTPMDSIPLTPNGKVDRLALPEPPPERPALDSVCLAPRNAVEERLARIWGNVLGVEPIGVQDNFFELGGHSLAAARLFAEIEEVFGKSLPLPLLLQAPTIEQLAAALRRDGRDEPGTFITGIQAKGSRPPLFCVETLNAGIFVHLARRLGPEQPCYGLHPLGLPRSRKPRVSIESLAARYLEEVRKVQPKGPYFLCGMCTGGVVAYEMAQQLKARGDEVAFLALLDTFSPPARWLNYASLCPGWGFIERRVRRGSGDVRDLSQPQSDGQAAYVRQLARPEPGFIAQQFQRGAKHLRNLSQLTLDGQAAYVRRLAAGRAARVEAARGLNKYLRQLAAYSRTLLRAGGRAGRWYRPKLYQGRLILFLANETTPRLRHGARLAWRELATGGAEVYSVPGVHELILSEPNVRVLAGYFKAHLEEAQTSARGPRT
ncbi:MAG: amino acid adenylation domain-containing protein [Candidatus Brocadiia bacterium]